MKDIACGSLDINSSFSSSVSIKYPPSIACPPNKIGGTSDKGFILFSIEILSASSR